MAAGKKEEAVKNKENVLTKGRQDRDTKNITKLCQKYICQDFFSFCIIFF